MKLYISAASSFSRKIRVMLIEKAVKHDVETINLWEPNDLKQTNPLGKVPALKLDDGRVLMNSPLIADYVDGVFPQPRFIPADAAVFPAGAISGTHALVEKTRITRLVQADRAAAGLIPRPRGNRDASG